MTRKVAVRDARGSMWKRTLLDASGTPLKNDSIVVTHVSAQGLCEGKLCSAVVSEERPRDVIGISKQ